MKYLVLSLCLLSATCSQSPVFAQESNPAQQKLEMLLGKLVIENLDLAGKLEAANKQLTDLKKPPADDKEKKDK